MTFSMRYARLVVSSGGETYPNQILEQGRTLPVRDIEDVPYQLLELLVLH